MAEEKKGSIFEEEKTEEEKVDEKEQFLDEPTEKEGEEKPANVYTEEGRDELVEGGEIADWEQGFSEGATQTGKAHCANCGKVLNEKQEELVEREIDRQNYYFCCNECASKGIEHAKKR